MCGAKGHVRFPPESGPGEKGEPRPELNEHSRNGHGKGILFCPDALVNEAGAIFRLIFCCRLASHTRAFSALFRAGSSFRVRWPSLVLATALSQRLQISLHRKIARKAMPLDDVGAFMSPNDESSRKIIAKEPRVQRGCVMPTMSALGHQQTCAAHTAMSAKCQKWTFCQSFDQLVANACEALNERLGLLLLMCPAKEGTAGCQANGGPYASPNWMVRSYPASRTKITSGRKSTAEVLQARGVNALCCCPYPLSPRRRAASPGCLVPLARQPTFLTTAP